MLIDRVINGYIHQLSLGTGRRFASKGGYFVHYAEAQGKQLAAAGEWSVP